MSNDKTVKVTLEIPIKEQNGQVNYVTYERFYYETNSGVSDEKNGRVIVKDFGLYLFPFLKVKNNVKADYRVNVMDFAGMITMICILEMVRMSLRKSVA